MTPRIGSACSGYGGLDLGLISVVGGSVAWHVENDKHPSAVLDARFPGVPNYGDLTAVDWTQVEPVDWFTAGYPWSSISDAVSAPTAEPDAGKSDPTASVLTAPVTSYPSSPESQGA